MLFRTSQVSNNERQSDYFHQLCCNAARRGSLLLRSLLSIGFLLPACPTQYFPPLPIRMWQYVYAGTINIRLDQILTFFFSRRRSVFCQHRHQPDPIQHHVEKIPDSFRGDNVQRPMSRRRRGQRFLLRHGSSQVHTMPEKGAAAGPGPRHLRFSRRRRRTHGGGPSRNAQQVGIPLYTSRTAIYFSQPNISRSIAAVKHRIRAP